MFAAGLIDYTADEYDDHYEFLESKWRADSEGKRFADYFRKNKLQEIKNTMLLEQRVDCGMDLDVYTQNASECTNQLIMRSMAEKRMTLDGIVDHMRDLAKRQRRATELCCEKETDGVSLHEDYHHLKIELYDSTTVITPAMRNARLERTHAVKLIVPAEIGVVKLTGNQKR